MPAKNLTHNMVPRAIVVDDEASSASVVAKLLQHEHCEVTVCTDPAAALEPALSGRVDLVSLDLSMPHLDGYQLLTLIRSHEHSRRLPSVPVITVTGRVTPEEKADALARGFAAHLGKPVMLEGLQCALARALTLRDELHRTRYTEDREAIETSLDPVLEPGSAASLPTLAGLALALEQQGYRSLYQALLSAHVQQPDAARAALRELARLAQTFGVARLCTCLDEMGEHLASGGDVLDTAAVLARAELDRVIFTLREQVRR